MLGYLMIAGSCCGPARRKSRLVLLETPPTCLSKKNLALLNATKKYHDTNVTEMLFMYELKLLLCSCLQLTRLNNSCSCKYVDYVR